MQHYHWFQRVLISNGKTAAQVIQSGYRVVTTNYNLKNNKLALKLVASLYDKTSFTNDSTLLIKFNTNMYNGTPISIGKENIQYAVDEAVSFLDGTMDVDSYRKVKVQKCFQTVIDNCK